jgi:hypothetical protein
VITPASGKVLSQVTLTKPADLLPENIAKDKNVCGVVGTLESGGGETPTDGDYLVRFFDYDGTILKEEWVDSGEDATPPNLPDYTVATNKRPALTFQGWNNSYTNITGNKDIGAIYIPTDGKTHAFVRLTVVSGKDVTLYLSKTDTSTLSIDWGDNITTTHTDSGNFNTSHTYSDYGDYEIKIWISSGSGEYGFGNGYSSPFVGKNILMYLFIGNNVSSIGDYAFSSCRSLTSINLPANLSSIGGSAFRSCRSILKYVFNRTTPPTLANKNAFYSINSICKIYVPNASVNAYKSATNWNTYADYIYPMSEMESD